MGNYNSLKATINANIKTNGNQEITGSVLNSVLNAMVSILGAGYQYAGIATPSTNPGTPDYRVFYIATTPGTYQYFNSLVVSYGEVVIFSWDSSWHKNVTGAATAARADQIEQEFEKGSYFTEEIRSKFVLHYTHNGDGTYGQNQARNAITTPLKYDYDVTVSVTSGHKFAVQYFDGYETGSSHFISATSWLTGAYTIPAGSYWGMSVANSNDSTTDESTTESLYFKGVADGKLLHERFSEIDDQFADTSSDISDLNVKVNQLGLKYIPAYTLGSLDISSNRRIVLNQNLACHIGTQDYVIQSGSTFNLSNISANRAWLWALIFDTANLAIIAKAWLDTTETDKIIATIAINSSSLITSVIHCVVPCRLDGKFFNGSETQEIRTIAKDSYSVLTAYIWDKFKLHRTHNGDGTYGNSQTRNAIDTPMVFDDDIFIDIEPGYKIALQYYDGEETGSSHLIFASPWITGNYTIPANTYWCIVVANVNDTATSERETQSLSFSNSRIGNIHLLNTLEQIKEISDAVFPQKTGIDYYGEKIELSTNVFRAEFIRWFEGQTWSQSMAIYNEFVVFFTNVDHTAMLFNISSGQLLGTFQLPNGGYYDPHGNVACIGKEFATNNSIMPLIYLSQWDAGHERACFVYDIQLNNGTYSLSLVQKINLSGVSSSIIGVGECDFVVDNNNDEIYAFAYKTSYNTDFGTATMVCRFALPSLSDGQEIFITDSDIVSYFEMALVKYRQDAFFKNGKIYIANGGIDDVKASISVINVVSQCVETVVPIYKFQDNEPECIDLYDDTDILFNYGNGIYRLIY